MITNDTPIELPEHDQFGIDPFSRAIANSISKIVSPTGTVLALTGSWGSGKSSAVNLVRFHLRSEEQAGHLNVIVFNPWWYSDEHALTRAYFQSLYVGLGKALSENARKVLLEMARGVLTAGPLVSAVNYFTFGLGGSLAAKVASATANSIKVERTVEDEFCTLSKELESQSKRFLVIIDDIDRLTPDQALLVFRLVKSVGRLPNVIYLLAFDRDFAERILNERYPAERHFLEKIVQASFEVPLPDAEVLHELLLRTLQELVGHPEQDKVVRFRNVLIDVVNPLIALPRDLVRFIGNVAVVWAAIGTEVDIADLLAIEALRLFKFPIYQAIRAHKLMLCGAGGNHQRSHKEEAQLYDSTLLGSIPDEQERERYRRALRRLFPRLDSVYGNVFHSSSTRIWQANRQICDPSHFSSYFKLALGPGIISRKVLDELLLHVSDAKFVRAFFLNHAKVVRSNGQSDVPIIMGELTAAADQIPTDAIPALLAALFKVADELDIERDEEPGGIRLGHELRLHWLLNALVRDRLNRSDRCSLFRAVVPQASLGWAISLTSRLRNEHIPERDGQKKADEERLVDSATLAELVAHTLDRIRMVAASKEIDELRHLLSALYRWTEFCDDTNVEVRAYTDSRLCDDEFVLRLAGSATSTSWVTSVGWDGMVDRVSQGVVRVQLDGLDSILDVEKFVGRMSELKQYNLSPSQRAIVVRFHRGLNNFEQDARRRAGSVSLDDLAE